MCFIYSSTSKDLSTNSQENLIVPNSNESIGKGSMEKISAEIPLESIKESQCEPVCLIIFSEKVHVKYIYPLLSYLEIVLKEQGICPKRLGEQIRSSEDYLKTLENLVDNCSLALIILDGFRPNVLFEFGYIKAKRKPIIILQSKDAEINIKTLYRETEHSGLSPKKFKQLNNPKIEISFHLSDFGGKHISYIDWSAKKTDTVHPSKVLKDELINKKGEIVAEMTRVKTKDLPPTLEIDVLESIIEVLGFYYSTEATISIEKIEELYFKLKALIEKYDMKPPIEIYDLLASICTRQIGNKYTASENINYLKAAQKINNDILGYLSIKDKELRAKILMRNGWISQRLLDSTNKTEYGHKAINTFEEALELFSSNQKKREYASAQNRIGETYSRLADIDDAEINCEKAILAFDEALKIRTREEFLFEYIQSQYNLGAVFYKLSEVKNRIKNSQRSIQELEKLQKLGKFKLLFSGYYGSIQNLLGVAHSNIAEVENKKEDFNEVFDFYQEALKQSSLDRDPLSYALIQNNLGTYFARMANIEKEIDLRKKYCTKAFTAFNKALEVYTYEQFPRDYSITKANLCEAYRILADIEDKEINCKKAIENGKEALKIQTPKLYPIDYAQTQLNLGVTYATLAEVKNPLDNYKESISRFNEVLKIVTPKTHPKYLAKAQKSLGDVYQNIAKIDEKKINCERSSSAYKAALKIYNTLGYKREINIIKEELKNLSDFCRS